MTSPDAGLPQRCAHVALVGAPNVGKSSLLNALIGEHLALVSAKAQATRLPVVGVRTEGEVQLIFHDTPGLLDPEYLLQQRMRSAALAELRRADIIVHLHPLAEAPAPPLARLVPELALPAVPLLVAYTKSDRAASPRGPGGAQEGPSAAPSLSFAISATTGAGLPALLGELARLAPIRPFEVDPDELGTQPMRFFVVEFLREAAFELLAEEVPYSFTAEVEEYREQADPVYIRAVLYVERESQKGILIGQGGRTLKAIGSHARARIEALLGTRVYLDCWVKVQPKWRRDPVLLTRWGFPAAADETPPPPRARPAGRRQESP
jgi:GTP-binding protein Era